ncbi:hypothetical protein JKP88DRAFT_269785 [Tribonema minus]|uniref:UDP-glucose 4-epimerase n=1 Tax=Tribonema minus TaxID=303371 RepID=A0A835YY50_9STRA|nr:hypothetical protein JKP88DRAFT_269785 [Tribonema minus]
MASEEGENGKRKVVLVCGGAGYIGSHTALVLLEAGFDVVVLDSFVNSSPESLERVLKITNCGPERLKWHKLDLCDQAALHEILLQYPPFDSCIHFAGLKAVNESLHEPLLYYHNNIVSTLNLLKELDERTCRKLVFSSSATVYGNAPAPITEESHVGQGITNPYGRTKYFIEEILRDFTISDDHHATNAKEGHELSSRWKIESLRYFNPTGAHPSGDIGEDPRGPPNNLAPYLSQVAVGRREQLTIFGGDYDTVDGTGVRDYVHVLDLAEGHLKALEYLDKVPCGFHTHNLGSGSGYSVLQMVKAMEKASGRPVPHVIGPRRQGDLASVYADPSLAKKELGWECTRGIDEMMRDLWAWQSKNPNGYRDA